MIEMQNPSQALPARQIPAIHESLAMNSWTRRDFTKTILFAGASTAVGAARAAGANERVRIGCIGLGNRGDQVLDAFIRQPDAEIVAVCDLLPAYMDFAARKCGNAPKQFKDYRKLLEMPGLDAVVIATPDHWHALQTIHACQAGKDVYVEKPLSLCVAEGRQMVKAVRNHNRVSQVGIHRRSVAVCREAADFVREGGLGKWWLHALSIFRTNGPLELAIRSMAIRRQNWIGRPGWAPLPARLTTKIAHFTGFDGSSIIAVAK